MLGPATKFPENRARGSDVSFAGLSYGVLSTKTSDDIYGGKYQGWHNMGIFGAHHQNKAIDKNVESEVCSPPLWRTSPPRSPQHRRNHYRSLSPSSKAEAIARGQKELMEMVSRMPEGCYELSLKDIVEHPRNMIGDDDHVKEENFSEGRGVHGQEEAHILRRGSEKEKKKRIEKKAQTNSTRRGSINNGGFLLKMVFPISVGSRKKKIRNANSTIMINNSFKDGRASPKPLLADINESAKVTTVDEEWWKNRFSEPGDSESAAGLSSSNSGSSKSSGSSSSRSSSRNDRTRQWRGACWPSIFSKRGKRAE